jgi:tetratricopeptide (TPR) repeat protein
MADHYTYLPLIGVFVAVAWGLGALAASLPALRRLIAASTVGALAALCLATAGQVRHWRDDDALYLQALAVEPDNWLAHLNLGASLAARGRTREAVAHFRASLALEPESVATLRNLGLALVNLGDPAGAIPWCLAAIRLQPGDPDLHALAGEAFAAAGRTGEAATAFRWALRLRPDHEVARRGLARLPAGPAPAPASP